MPEYLGGWLRWERRPEDSFDGVLVGDYAEVSPPPTAEVRRLLADLLVEARFDPTFLEEAASEMGWGPVREIVQRLHPTGTTLKRGYFGEALSARILSEIHGYLIPIAKLRFAITGGQSLPGTDLLVLRAEGRNVTEVSFIESKLRTKRAVRVPLDGYEQLRADYENRLSETQFFVAQRLRDIGHPLYESFMRYMRRRAGASIDTFNLVLVWEPKAWDETSLTLIEDAQPKLDRTEVHVVQIEALATLVEEVYRAVGASVGPEEEEDDAE